MSTNYAINSFVRRTNFSGLSFYKKNKNKQSAASNFVIVLDFIVDSTHTRNTCVTAYSNLVTESSKYGISRSKCWSSCEEHRYVLMYFGQELDKKTMHDKNLRKLHNYLPHFACCNFLLLLLNISPEQFCLVYQNWKKY